MDYDEIILDADNVVVAGVALFGVEGPNSNGDRDVGFFLLPSASHFLHPNSKYIT